MTFDLFVLTNFLNKQVAWNLNDGGLALEITIINEKSVTHFIQCEHWTATEWNEFISQFRCSSLLIDIYSDYTKSWLNARCSQRSTNSNYDSIEIYKFGIVRNRQLRTTYFHIKIMPNQINVQSNLRVFVAKNWSKSYSDNVHLSNGYTLLSIFILGLVSILSINSRTMMNNAMVQRQS